MQELYKELLEKYGQQGWWPLLGSAPEGRYTSYHPGNYSLPDSDDDRLQVSVGAILTQNTNWLNVEKALHNLSEAGALSARGLREMKLEHLAELIRPSGYYNQKARKLKIFIQFFAGLEGRMPDREELLSLWGIGRETADSILLYAYQKSIMVIDNYTRRVFKAAGIKGYDLAYDKLRQYCEQQMPDEYRIMQEFHALLVKAGKELNK
ncbi:MAG: endonuclease III domain-containing protein [Candidatus Cloacimonetes bacterium]|nr:endonuclease III domain-containing protein [Candidatus Cloacimonadota bacterium]